MRTDLALRRLLDALKSSQDQAISSAATSISQEMETTASGYVTEHATKRQYVHGTGPYYVAKTSRGDQWPSWKDLKDIPADLQETDFDPSEIEIDADQVISGIFPLTRLPVADNGEISSTELVRADDARLLSHQWSVVVGSAVSAGDFVCVYNDGGAEKLKRADSGVWETSAIGFVSESYGIGETAIVFPVGINALVYLPSVSIADLTKTVFLGSDGKGTLDPSGVTVLQPLGTIVQIVSTTIAAVFVQWEWRLHL